jgi:hypothetical protein
VETDPRLWYYLGISILKKGKKEEGEFLSLLLKTMCIGAKIISILRSRCIDVKKIPPTLKE